MKKSWLFLCRNAKRRKKIFRYNYGEKSMGSPFISYSDLECILKQMSTRRHNNPEKSSTTKINERAPSDFSLFSYC